MESINTLVTLPFPDPLIEKLENASPRVTVQKQVVADEAELAAAIEETEVLYASRLLPQPDEAPNLRWVQLHSAGVDHIADHVLFTDTAIKFTTTSGIHAVNMAEYAMGQILAFAHHLPRMLEDQQAAAWPEDRWDRYVPRELRGATLGIVGYGSIGREIARLGTAFGMTVLAVKNNLRQLSDEGKFRLPGTGDPEAELPERIYPVQALHSFLGECDFVVLTVPLTESTRHLVDAGALAAMKPGAVLVNVARGGVVDERALAEALSQGKLGGAALDVFEQEPLPEDSPLWKLPNVIISPHVSGFTPHYDERATDLFAENLRRYAAGEPLLNEVSRQRGY